MLKRDLYNLKGPEKNRDEASALLTSVGFETGLSFMRNELPSFSLAHTQVHAHVYRSLT